MSVNAASPIKRIRATRDEMEARMDALLDITAEMQPMTVRQVFYQASVRGVVDKTETGYGKVQRALVDLRRRVDRRQCPLAAEARVVPQSGGGHAADCEVLPQGALGGGG